MGRIAENLSPSTVTARALQTRGLVRAPIWLYRHGLGFLLGSRMVMIEHIGRKSGEARYVVLEVAERPDADTVIVSSGFGEKAQWYRNLRATPDCHVTVGRTRRAARAELLDHADSDAALERYKQQHPAAWQRLKAALDEAWGEPVEHLPMVRFHLR